MYYVYLIKNEGDETYIGFTSNLRKRLEYHNKGMNQSTRGHKWELIYYEAYKSEQDARDRETTLKESSQAKRWLKERLKRSMTLGK